MKPEEIESKAFIKAVWGKIERTHCRENTALNVSCSLPIPGGPRTEIIFVHLLRRQTALGLRPSTAAEMPSQHALPATPAGGRKEVGRPEIPSFQ